MRRCTSRKISADLPVLADGSLPDTDMAKLYRPSAICGTAADRCLLLRARVGSSSSKTAKDLTIAPGYLSVWSPDRRLFATGPAALTKSQGRRRDTPPWRQRTTMPSVEAARFATFEHHRFAAAYRQHLIALGICPDSSRSGLVVD
jgi:hypothetical protein